MFRLRGLRRRPRRPSDRTVRMTRSSAATCRARCSRRSRTVSSSMSMVRRPRRLFGVETCSSPSTTVTAWRTCTRRSSRSTSNHRNATPHRVASPSPPSVGRAPRCGCLPLIAGSRGRERRRVRKSRDVARDECLAFGVVEHLVQNGVHVMNRRQGKTDKRPSRASSPSPLTARPRPSDLERRPHRIWKDSSIGSGNESPTLVECLSR